MGFLHDGHMALVNQARRNNDIVIASLFVNPTQFAAHEDFDTYPQDMQRDRQLLADAGVDIVLEPLACEIYGQGKTHCTSRANRSSSLLAFKQGTLFLLIRGRHTIPMLKVKLVDRTFLLGWQLSSARWVQDRRSLSVLALCLRVYTAAL